MREWADVFIPALDERIQLAKKALFFIPRALERCATNELTVAHLDSISRTAAFEGPRAGRNAIAKVFRVQPVSYESARGFLAVANLALREIGAAELTTRDIIACVFRLRDPQEVLIALKMPWAEMASAAGRSRELAQAAVSKYRLQLVDALAFWRVVRAHVQENGSQSAFVNEIITDDPRDFIKTDVRAGLPIAVRRLDDFEYVYRWDNLQYAPLSGHFWALESDEETAG